MAALRQARGVLSIGGGITVVAYRGHPGGQSEESAVADWWKSISEADYQKRRIASDESNQKSPILYVVIKQQHITEATAS